MMTVEVTSIANSSLPVAELGHVLRLATGFGDDPAQEGQLQSCLRAAICAIEARIGKALFERRFSIQLSKWHSDSTHALPLAPVRAVEQVTLISRGGQETLLDPDRYRLAGDAHRPKLVAMGGRLPQPALGGSIEILLTAGYGPLWADIPADLRQAALILAGDFFNHAGQAQRDFNPAVAVLLEPYRVLRVTGGQGT